jgi:hypothetical protein
MNKLEQLKKVSNYSIVRKKAKMLYKRDVFPSTRKNKKYMIKNDKGNFVHFGHIEYEDYTKHKDKTRRKNYLTRASNIKGNWKKDPFSPNHLSLTLTW